jgi:hypothetical protein
MALPHYHTMPRTPDPVYQNLFEIILISPTFILLDELFDQKLEFINSENENLVNLSFTISEDFLKGNDLCDVFKDIHYIHLTTHDSKGYIIKRELILVKFKSSKFTFQYSDPKLLEIDLVVENIASEECSETPHSIQKRIIRESKIDSCLES